MNDKSRETLVRAATAFFMLPVVLFLLWHSPSTTAGLLAFASGVMAYEFYDITLKKLEPGQVVGILCAGLMPVLLVAYPDRFTAIVTVMAAGLPILLFTYYLLAGPLPEAPLRVSLVFTGVFYCGLLLATVGGLRAREQGLSWVILTLAVTWMNDTGAYAFGRAFGKHKIYPAVSPGKSWEGFFGGILVSTAAAFVVRATLLPSLSVADCLLIALPCSVLGPLGDFSESMLKRAYGVKDSGKIMPGHGGFLDRVDAVLFNAPYILLYVTLTRG